MDEFKGEYDDSGFDPVDIKPKKQTKPRAPRTSTKKEEPVNHKVIFFSQLFMSVLVTCFSMYMLFYNATKPNEDIEGRLLYVSLISTIVGVWLPQPRG